MQLILFDELINGSNFYLAIFYGLLSYIALFESTAFSPFIIKLANLKIAKSKFIMSFSINADYFCYCSSFD